MCEPPPNSRFYFFFILPLYKFGSFFSCTDWITIKAQWVHMLHSEPCKLASRPELPVSLSQNKNKPFLFISAWNKLTNSGIDWFLQCYGSCQLSGISSTCLGLTYNTNNTCLWQNKNNVVFFSCVFTSKINLQTPILSVFLAQFHISGFCLFSLRSIKSSAEGWDACCAIYILSNCTNCDVFAALYDDSLLPEQYG